MQGIRFGLIIAICAIGLSLIFGTTGLTNFSHGEMVTFGALIAYLFNVTIGWHMYIAAPLAIAVAVLLGAGLDRFFWRPLRNRGTGLIAMLVISIGLGIFLRYLFNIQFGGFTRTYAQFSLQRDGIEIGPVNLVPRDLVGMIISVVALVAVGAVPAAHPDGQGDAGGGRQPRPGRVVGHRRRPGHHLRVGGGRRARRPRRHPPGPVRAGELADGLPAAAADVRRRHARRAGHGLRRPRGQHGRRAWSMELSTLWIPSEFKNVTALAILIVILVVRPQGILGQAERVG